MPAVQLPNGVVTGPINTPIPNPITPIDTPVDIGPIVDPVIDTPVISPAVSPPTLSTPVLYAASALDPTTPPFPLNHARILYNNLLSNAAVSASGGTNEVYTLIPNTFQAWGFTLTTSQTILITLPINQNIDTICIGAHNLSGASVTVEYDTDLTDPTILFAPVKSPATNDALMFHVDTPVSARRVRITISGSTGLDYKIGFISAGIALQMARPFFSGHNPMNQNKKHRYYDAWTETGQMVGRSKRSVQLEGDFSWDNLPDIWYRTYMPAFIESATLLPYFISWNLLEHANDCAMSFTDEDINSSYSGTRDLRSVSFSARGIA